MILVDTGASAGLYEARRAGIPISALPCASTSSRMRKRDRSLRAIGIGRGRREARRPHPYAYRSRRRPRRLSDERDPGQLRASSRSRLALRVGCAATFRSAGRRASIRSRCALDGAAYGPFARSRALDLATARSLRWRRPATRAITSRSSSRTATRRSSSPATPPTRRRPCSSGRIDGVGADESAELADARRHPRLRGVAADDLSAGA